MNKKIYLQLFLFIIIIIISSFFFKKYFFISDDKKLIQEVVKNEKNSTILSKSNLIKNIEYVSQDSRGNAFIIKSELGEINNDDPELILMERVTAIIELKDSSPINIFADNAIYNNISYNTNFYGNVFVTYNDSNLKSNNMDLLFNKDLAIIYNDVFYENLNTELLADKVEIDLISKNARIFMEAKSKKVKVKKIN